MNEEATPGPLANPLDRITTDPSICHGQPRIRGLRYPVDAILDLLSSGMTTQDILDDYDDLEAEDVSAVLAFAAPEPRQERTGISLMKFLVDAQLPLRLARWRRERGHDAVHTRELPDRNRHRSGHKRERVLAFRPV